MALVAEHRDRTSLARRVDETFGKGPELDKLLKVELYPYQREGALFAAQAGRCLLADDMGLGKTIQAIAAAEILARAAGVERVLIVCPTSLKHQWQAGDRAVLRPHAPRWSRGSPPQRARLYASDSLLQDHQLRRGPSRPATASGHWAPDLIILDEAQRIKNWKTRTAQTVKRLDSDLRHRPDRARRWKTGSRSCTPSSSSSTASAWGRIFRFLAEHQQVDELGQASSATATWTRISRTLAPILLRRKKDEVLKDLPERIDKHFFVPMTEQQMDASRGEPGDRGAASWPSGAAIGSFATRTSGGCMIALQNMRMSCNSTYLVDQSTDFGAKADELMTVLARCSRSRRPRWSSSASGCGCTNCSTSAPGDAAVAATSSSTAACPAPAKGPGRALQGGPRRAASFSRPTPAAWA